MESRFGVRLREDRMARGMTVRQLAEAAQVNYSYITKIETSDEAIRVSDAIVRSLARSLDVDELEYLHIAGLIPEPLGTMLACRESREFYLAAESKNLTPEDWLNLRKCLSRLPSSKKLRARSKASA
jgi:transcriptional regulator with XRE-family HTH domain